MGANTIVHNVVPPSMRMGPVAVRRSLSNDSCLFFMAASLNEYEDVGTIPKHVLRTVGNVLTPVTAGKMEGGVAFST